MQEIGVKDCNIYFGGSKINKILQENESMSLDILKQAVTLLEKPILIMKSRTVEDSVVLFGEVFDNDGKLVMISVLIDPKDRNGEVLDYIAVTSAYGRRKGNIQNLIDNSTIYYIDPQKQRTDTWLKALGLHLPSAITTYGSINSISDSGEKNNPREKFSLAMPAAGYDSQDVYKRYRGRAENVG